MLDSLDTLDYLKTRLRDLVWRLTPVDGEGFLSLVLDLPGTVPDLPRISGPQFQFQRGRKNRLRMGLGIAAEWRAAGPHRLEDLRRQARTLSAVWRQEDPDQTGFRGFALVGFSAHPATPGAKASHALPEALIWVPELAVQRDGDQAVLVLTTRLPARRADLLRRWDARLEQLVPALHRPASGPAQPAALARGDDTPDRTGWASLVRSGLRGIADREFDKVVVTRRLRIRSSRRFDIHRLMAGLRTSYPSCQVIHVHRSGTSFAAATPERLLSLRGQRAEADALAGTASRGVGPAEDDALARALQCSAKNLHEHRLVVEAIREALSPQLAEIHIPRRPRIMKLNNAQHLWSPIRARLRAASDLLELAGLLHPTPATNGQPRAAADRWLRRMEPFQRGWYTGVAGIMEPDLTGELWVLLRCASIRGDTADLYAGAGIVDGSDPAAEWQETEHKLGAMLTALQCA
jgi:menaquinone-specific isochorismate synthase